MPRTQSAQGFAVEHDRRDRQNRISPRCAAKILRSAGVHAGGLGGSCLSTDSKEPDGGTQERNDRPSKPWHESRGPPIDFAVTELTGAAPPPLPSLPYCQI